MFGGHYTAYVKNANNKWYLFNDTHAEIKKRRSYSCFVFFYRKYQNNIINYYIYTKLILIQIQILSMGYLDR